MINCDKCKTPIVRRDDNNYLMRRNEETVDLCLMCKRALDDLIERWLEGGQRAIA